MKSVLVRIRGRVQGVWFRRWTEETARAASLAGWVRNRRDGSVEALFGGPADAVDRMVVLCGIGPKLAKVTSVDQEPADPPDSPQFLVLPTE